MAARSVLADAPVLSSQTRLTLAGDGDQFHVSAVWSGGPYVDLHWGYGPIDPEASTAFDVINIWDYRRGCLQDGMSLPGALKRELRDWYASLGDTPSQRRSELSNYARHTM